MEQKQLKNILEAILLTADNPMDIRKMEALFEVDEDRPSRDDILQAIESLQSDYAERGVELKEIASGYRMQVVPDTATWVSRMWEEKPPRYSRALLETLVLIAYRQPITRGEIEEIRGVSVSTHIVKTLTEREWVKVLGHKDVPGRPSMYGTTRSFLDYFNLKSLDELPSLADITDLDKLHPELALEMEVAAADEDNGRDAADMTAKPEAELSTESVTEPDSEQVTDSAPGNEGEINQSDDVNENELPSDSSPEQAEVAESSLQSQLEKESLNG